jgi:hypothetical protein
LAAASRKSPKTAGGVNLLGGSGPFQPLRRTGCRGSRLPGGELERARRIFAAARGGDDERARDTAFASADAFLPQDLVAAAE